MSNKFESFLKYRKIILIALVIVSGVLLFIYYYFYNSSNKEVVSHDNVFTPGFNETGISNPELIMNSSVDSILYTFGIKKEWITNDTSKNRQKAGWFVKTVLIPKDLASEVINLDISNFLNRAGLSSSVNEDILSKDITIKVNDPDSTKKLPAAIIEVKHTDKVRREMGVISVIIDKINEFSPDEIDKYIISKNEFSYVFPRNLDDIDIQNKLLQHKKDIVINMSVGQEDNIEADFIKETDEKTIREKAKNFNADYPTINKVLLTKSPGTEIKRLQNHIAAEFGRYNIIIINDTMLTPAHKSDEKDKLGNFFSILKQKAIQLKHIVTVLPMDSDDFDNFYNRVLELKKLGFKFFNLTDYFNYVKEEQKKEKEEKEKLKNEQEKKKTKPEVKKKQPEKKKETQKKENKKQPEKKKK